MSAIVTLKKGEGRTIKAGGAWIYDNEIDTIMGSFENGDIIIVKVSPRKTCTQRNPQARQYFYLFVPSL